MLFESVPLRKTRQQHNYLKSFNTHTMDTSPPGLDFLSAPDSVRTMLESMMQGTGDDQVITKAEKDSLLEDHRGRVNTGVIESENHGPRQFTPHGEGGSGNVVVPDLISTSKSEIDISGTDLDSVVDPQDHDTEVGEAPQRSSSPGTPGVETQHGSQDDLAFELEITKQAFERFVEDKVTQLSTQMDDIRTHLKLEIDSLTRQVLALQTSVHQLRMSPATGVTTATLPPAKSTAKSDPGNGQQSSLTTPSKPVHVRTPSVASLSGVVNHKQILEEFLTTTPVYPKFAKVREAKLSRLATSLGWKSPKMEVTPRDWTVEGLLQKLTTEG